MEWLPIESAPKDGTLIVLYGPGRDLEVPRGPFSPPEPENIHALGSWVDTTASWFTDAGDGLYRKETGRPEGYWEVRMLTIKPTHWMPLPDPPAGWVPDGFVKVEGLR